MIMDPSPFFTDFLSILIESLQYTAKLDLNFCDTGDGFGSFLLKYNNYSATGNSKTTRTAKYSIAFQYLLLEGITEDSDQELLID